MNRILKKTAVMIMAAAIGVSMNYQGAAVFAGTNNNITKQARYVEPEEWNRTEIKAYQFDSTDKFENYLLTGGTHLYNKNFKQSDRMVKITVEDPGYFVVSADTGGDGSQKVKLYDTYPGLILLYISTVIPFTVLILRNFVGEIPISLEEAAAIDGATFSQRLFTIVLPLMKPAIATVCIINFITCLNNFFTPLFYSNGIQVLSVAIVQLPLRDNMYGVPWDLVSAMGWIILLPIIIFVAVFEKQIMDGIMAGGVKA